MLHMYAHTYAHVCVACAANFHCSGRETASPFADSLEEDLPLLKAALTSCPESDRSRCLRQFLMVDLSTNSRTSGLLSKVQAGPAHAMSAIQQAKSEILNAKCSLGTKLEHLKALISLEHPNAQNPNPQ